MKLLEAFKKETGIQEMTPEILRSIIDEVNKGTKSGMWGKAAKKLSDLTGGAIAGDATTYAAGAQAHLGQRLCVD